MNIQFKKGVLDLCVLSLLSRKDRYGYELVNEISKRIDLSEGTIYPLLKRLRDEGLVSTYLEESQEGPPRKYYRLTDGGRQMYGPHAAEVAGRVYKDLQQAAPNEVQETGVAAGE